LTITRSSYDRHRPGRRETSMFTGIRLMQVAATLAILAALAAGCGGDSGNEATQTTTETQTTETDTTTETTPPTTTEEEPPGPTVVQVTVVNGAPKGGIVRETVEQDDRVLLVVASDVADEVHLHGYDISRDVAAGGTVRLRFRAKLPGRFEVELENRGVPIAELTVEP
jgi:ABC-type glycerol-3-phosphate transport system substrate-binding protein